MEGGASRQVLLSAKYRRENMAKMRWIFCRYESIMGLDDWRHGRRAWLLDTCRTGQDVFVLGLRQFGHARIAAAVEKTIGVST